MRGHTSLSLGLLLVIFGGGLLFGQPARCTQDSVVGTYAVAAEGTMLVTPPGASQPMPVPIANLSLVWIDRTGVMSGQGFGSLGGAVSETPGAGSIQVNPDCTAVLKTAVGTSSVDVILNKGEEMQGLMVQAPGGKPVVRGIARRISRLGCSSMFCHPPFVNLCSASDVHGIYAVNFQGTYMVSQPGTPQPVPVPSLGVALASIDGQGQISGFGTITMAGEALDYQIARGQIDVQPDCTAIAQMSVQSGAVADEGKSWLVVLDGGDELWAIQTESRVAEPIVTAIWKRISPIP